MVSCIRWLSISWFYFLSSYLGEIIERKRCLERNIFLDKQAFLTVEGEEILEVRKSLDNRGTSRKIIYIWHKSLGNSPISFDTSTKILTNGEETFHAILEELKKARHHIHLEYYIVRHDHIGQEIKRYLN